MAAFATSKRSARGSNAMRTRSREVISLDDLGAGHDRVERCQSLLAVDDCKPWRFILSVGADALQVCAGFP